MDATLNAQLSLAALVTAAAALFLSLMAAFPGLKSVLAAVRDGILWFSLFLVLGAAGFVVWQNLQQQNFEQQTTARSAAIPSNSRVADAPPRVRDAELPDVRSQAGAWDRGSQGISLP